MASSKRPTYKVETKLPIVRKRRSSDLVLMWQSIWGVSAIIAKELWLTLIRMWEFMQLWFSSSERFIIQRWLEKYLPYVPEDFSSSWRDGRLFAILLNSLRPGSFPDANRLDSDYGLKNVYRVFDALEVYFGIKPNVSVEEIVTCIDGSDLKLFEILLELKNLTENQLENQIEPEPEPNESPEQFGISQSCIAKGTGLAVGFVGKTTNFIIFCALMSDLDVVVEIKGPNSICSERITKRSPKRKSSVPSWEYSRPLARSVSLNENNDEKNVSEVAEKEDENFGKRIIPLEYQIIGNQISLSYKPQEKGKHKVTILWHGQHISDSPYLVIVEDPSELTGAGSVIHLKSALKNAKNEISEKPRKISVRFQESGMNYREPRKRSGKILSRRVLRYIVKIQGKDVPVNAENTESLAAELLKMDYDFEKWPSFHRRNSWGFTGDAERKKSVIRQFCVDVNELDAQFSLRRSRSLSLNPGSKKLLQRSDSFDSLASNLNIVSEHIFEINEKSQENEEDYAYINEDADEINQVNKVKYNKADYVRRSTRAQKGDSELSSELSKRKFVDSSKENPNHNQKSDKISSLSTDVFLIEHVDNSKDDLHSDILSRSPILRFNEPNVGNENKLSVESGCLGLELHRGYKENETESTDPKSLKSSQIPINCKIAKKTFKRKMYANKYNSSRSLRRYRLKRRFRKFSVVSFYKYAPKNNSVSLSLITILRKRRNNDNYALHFKKNKPILKIFNTKCSNKPEKPKFEYKNELINNDRDFRIEDLNNISHSTRDTKKCETGTHFIKERFVKNTDLKTITQDNHAFKHESHGETKTKNLIRVSESKKLNLNHNLKDISLPKTKIEAKDTNFCKNKLLITPAEKPMEQFSINHKSNAFPTCFKESEVETKDASEELPKPLRTHTLKTIEQFSFKQFNPSFEAQNSISPVKLQIGHWENTLSSEKPNTSSQKIFSSDTEQVNVKKKLAFWENASKTEQNIIGTNKKMNLTENKKSRISVVSNSNCARQDFQNSQDTGKTTSTLVSIIHEKTETSNSVNKETNLAAKIRADDKISSEFQNNSRKINGRSFSDPVMLETTVEEQDISLNFSLESPKEVYASSSTDDNVEQYDSDDSEDSGGDYILQSTEDEYIDDEISESAPEYWGDLSFVKGWKVARCTEEYPFLGEEFLQNYQRSKSYPEQCKVFGIAVYYGYVAVKNRFQVYTGDAGFGNLSVSMQGFRQHEVSLISVAYLRNDIYEVTYQVMTAGYYLISIHWMDKEIPGSPFVCKITF